MDHVLNALARYGPGNHQRQVLENNLARHVWESLFERKALLACTATDINEQQSLRAYILAKVLLKGLHVQKGVLAFATGSVPLVEVVKMRWHTHCPLEGH